MLAMNCEDGQGTGPNGWTDHSDFDGRDSVKHGIAAIAFLMGIVGSQAAFAERPELLELQVGGQTLEGQAVAYNQQDFWLMQRDGRLEKLKIGSVSKFRTIAPRFQPYRAADMRTELRKEFGRAYEVVGTGHYLVVATPGTGREIADLLEENYRSFVTQFNVRGFKLDTPKFPMVAVVFPSQDAFAAYARKEGVPVSKNILGYYQPASNRIALFDHNAGTLIKSDPPIGLPGGKAFFAKPAGLNSSLKDTIVHEGIHQIAFNTGIHSRLGQNPKWIVEGLATVFEAEGIRNRSGNRGAKSRINAERLKNFIDYGTKRRKRRTLSAFVSSDFPFQAAVIDAYAESWALTYFLIETRSKSVSKYLQILADRDPLQPYSARERLSDFQKAFGKDPDKLEVEYLRFMADVVRSSASTSPTSTKVAATELQFLLRQAAATQKCRCSR